MRKVFDIKAYSLDLKRQTMEAYGGKCQCCGIKQLQFLTIDHINNNGKEERLKYGSGKQFYALLKRQGWPNNGYRVLCMNCNWARRHGQQCPHELKRERKRARLAGLGGEGIDSDARDNNTFPFHTAGTKKIDFPENEYLVNDNDPRMMIILSKASRRIWLRSA